MVCFLTDRRKMRFRVISGVNPGGHISYAKLSDTPFVVVVGGYTTPNQRGAKVWVEVNRDILLRKDGGTSSIISIKT